MFTFYWLDPNCRKTELPIRDPVVACDLYKTFNSSDCYHNLKVLYETDKIRTYVVFVNDRVVPV